MIELPVKNCKPAAHDFNVCIMYAELKYEGKAHGFNRVKYELSPRFQPWEHVYVWFMYDDSMSIV